jgi:hypothetical protein
LNAETSTLQLLQARSCFALAARLLLLAVSLRSATAAAPLDPSKLPPPARTQIEFDRDVKPILEKSCFQCHGPERPKSHFRLDNRESALKGGDQGVDIVPGDSAKSPLIFYVARLVDEMEMPPPKKGTPLTPEQVGLLRAWIDQGLPWTTTNTGPALAFAFAPTLRWLAVSGNQSKFREIEGMKEGFGTGLENFSLTQQLDRDTRFSVDGHALFPDQDIRVSLSLQRTDVGFVHAGFEQWRRYYDDVGGYYRPFSPPALALTRDLYLDLGHAWIDFGLTRPHLPQIVVGYEYQFKDGAKSTLAWGNTGGKLIVPAAKTIDEHTHVIKADLTHDFYEWHLEDNARIEIYDSRTSQDNVKNTLLLGPPEGTVRTRESFTHIQGMNALHLERQVTPWWLLSGGYLYSLFHGGAGFDQTTVNVINVPVKGIFWSADDLVLRRESHIISLGNLFLPVQWLSASAGVQSEWTRQQGAGRVNLDSGDPDPTIPGAFTLYPSTIDSDLDKQKLSENIFLRFTAIPFTVLFADARFDQESIGQFEQDLPQSGTTPDPEVSFLRNTDFTNHREDWRAGFNLSPWPWLALNSHYRKLLSDSDYDNQKNAGDEGYPAFIRARQIDTDEVQAKLVLRPSRWLKAALTYQLVSTDYHTTTEIVPGATFPEGLTAGIYDANVYGLNLTLTPLNRLYLSSTFTYSDSRTSTAQNHSPSVVPYKGDVYSLLASATYAWNDLTSLQASYSFSRSAYGQPITGENLPLGLDYTRHSVGAGISRKLTSFLTSNLRYAFFQYREPSSGQFNDYTAHGLFATLIVNWH